jgi:hypothetical protein
MCVKGGLVLEGLATVLAGNLLPYTMEPTQVLLHSTCLAKNTLTNAADQGIVAVTLAHMALKDSQTRVLNVTLGTSVLLAVQSGHGHTGIVLALHP